MCSASLRAVRLRLPGGCPEPPLPAGADTFKGAAVDDVEVPESPPLKEPLKPTAPPPTRWQV